jgi:hypothetical protein
MVESHDCAGDHDFVARQADVGFFEVLPIENLPKRDLVNAAALHRFAFFE